jgi:tetratricopeptide (TPR) repeat protein
MIRYYPNTAWAWTSAFYLAETYAHQGKLDTAIKVYAALASNEQAPRNLRAQAQLRIGDLYITDQKWLEALQTYKHTLRDYNDIPGVAVTCEDKLKVATEGRRYGRVPYRQVKTGVHLSEAPPDEGYRLKQQQEKVPYSE